MIEKTFLNPTTNKQWRIEIDGHTIRTCLNGGKVKQILCDSAFQVRSKAASAMMGQMRKGFVYQNRDAAVGQARCHRFVGKDSNGFMPLAASPARDDFFLTRVVGDFEDETLYHFDGSGESLETVCLLVLRNPVTHINIDVDVEEMVQDKRGMATYGQIKEYVLEHSGLKVSSLYIAQVKQKHGIIERENYNKPKSDDARQPQCPLEKERAITEALKHFGML